MFISLTLTSLDDRRLIYVLYVYEIVLVDFHSEISSFHSAKEARRDSRVTSFGPRFSRRTAFLFGRVIIFRTPLLTMSLSWRRKKLRKH